MSVDLPEPLAPRIPKISRRLMFRLILSTARVSFFADEDASNGVPAAGLRQGHLISEPDSLNTFETPSTTTASIDASMMILSNNGLFTIISWTAKFCLLYDNEASFP